MFNRYLLDFGVNILVIVVLVSAVAWHVDLEINNGDRVTAFIKMTEVMLRGHTVLRLR